ncbi:putative 4-carboxymuconolactone decarboxylase [Xylogone sp. PMI_703]|nr:putative 4-carboxymuconolactone decarboxylase [Xylogone sp. PMI_703]
MRVPYIPDQVPTKDEAESAIVEQVRARRQPGPLLELDRALLYSPSVAQGWNFLFGSIRQKTCLSADIRELAISRIALIHKSQYEWSQHAPLAKEAGINEHGLRGDGEDLTPKQLAVLRYTDAMTEKVFVSDDIFQDLKRYFTDREVVEITATVAVYNCCSRFLIALDVGERNDQTDVAKWEY